MTDHPMFLQPSQPTDYGARAREAAVLAAVDLPDVSVREHTDLWTGNVAMRIVQSFASGRQMIAQTFIPREVIDDCPPALIGEMVGRTAWRSMRPWLEPHGNPFPVIDLFPRWTRFRAFLGRVRQHLAREGDLWD